MLVATSTFERWSTAHLAMLAATVMLALILFGVCRAGTGSRVAFRIGPVLLVMVAILIAGSEIGGHIWRISLGTWDHRTDLPLHLCDLTGVLVIWLLMERAVRFSQPPGRIARHFEELAYFWTLGGTTQALLTPDLPAGPPSWPYWEFFISHGSAWAAVVGLVASGQLHVRRGAYWSAWWITLVAGCCVGLLNLPLQSNYMYTCGPPGQASVYDYFGPWPWSLASLAIVGLLLFVFCEVAYRLLPKPRQV